VPDFRMGLIESARLFVALCLLLRDTVIQSENSRHLRIGVRRVLWSLAWATALVMVALSGATYFGYLPGPQFHLSAEAPAADISMVVAPQPLSPLAPPKIGFNREDVLNDHLARINDAFAVDDGLRERVGFWFDVYTKFDENRRILHHSRFPWVIFKVVDVTSIIESDTPRRRWMRNEKADKFVKSEATKIRESLRRISRSANLAKLKAEDKELVEALRPLGKDIRKSARIAAQSVRMQVGQKNHFESGLAVSTKYLSSMEKIFADAKLPTELTRLPFVESSFNETATSRVGAAGIWQFMTTTGRQFKLVINDRIDERRSPLKASEAAARLLKENHMILHRSWPLAVTAWNHGPQGVRKAMKASGSRDIHKIIARYSSRNFNFASSNFYAEFLAALYAEKYHDLIFDVERGLHLNLHVVSLPRSIRLNELIKVSGLSRDEFLAINPDLLKTANINGLVPAGFKFHVTAEARATIERRFALAVADNNSPRS